MDSTERLTESEVERLSRDLEIRVREVEKLNRDVERLSRDLATRGGEVEELNRCVERLSGGLEAREQEVRGLNRDVERLSRDLEARGREVEKLNRDLQGMGAQAGRAFPEPESRLAPLVPPRSAEPQALTSVRRRVKAPVAGLLWTLVRTDFKVRYQGTVAGFLWALLKPLTMLMVLLGVFSFVFASAPDYALNLIVGLFLWDYFVEGTRVGLLSLAAKGYLLTKTRVPRFVLVLASGAGALLTLSVFFLALLVFLAMVGRPPGVPAVALFALYLLQLSLMVLGFSLAASVLFLRYRDLNQVWEVATQAGFFLAPIVYPLSILPERFHFYLYLWPPTPVIQYSRSVLIAGVVPSLHAHLLLAAVTALIFATGVSVFRHLAPDAAEHL